MNSFTSVEDFKEKCGYDIEGEWYPRVTKIVGIKSKPALHYFYASMPNYKEAERMKNQSAMEGTRVHNAVENIMMGRDIEYDPDIQPSIDAFREFLDMYGCEVNPNFVEYRLCHSHHRYAGTLDAIVTIRGKVGVMDIKTSQAIYRDYNLQTSAYMEAMRDKMPELQTRWILRIDQDQVCANCNARLRKKGGREKIRTDKYDYAFRTCNHKWSALEGRVELKEFPEWENDFNAFLAAKQLWEWENNEFLNEVGY